MLFINNSTVNSYIFVYILSILEESAKMIYLHVIFNIIYNTFPLVVQYVAICSEENCIIKQTKGKQNKSKSV